METQGTYSLCEVPRMYSLHLQSHLIFPLILIFLFHFIILPSFRSCWFLGCEAVLTCRQIQVYRCKKVHELACAEVENSLRSSYVGRCRCMRETEDHAQTENNLPLLTFRGREDEGSMFHRNVGYLLVSSHGVTAHKNNIDILTSVTTSVICFPSIFVSSSLPLSLFSLRSLLSLFFLYPTYFFLLFSSALLPFFFLCYLPILRADAADSQRLWTGCILSRGQWNS
jgi:hypothetical protein